MSQDYLTHHEHILDTKAESPPPRVSFSPPLTGPGLKRRGVERLPVTIHNISDEAINALIVEKVTGLAKDHKRVYGIPKRLQDGIALDWVYDKEVGEEDTHTILRKIGLKLEPTVGNDIPRSMSSEHGPQEAQPLLDASYPDSTIPQRPSTLPSRLGKQLSPVPAPLRTQSATKDLEQFGNNAQAHFSTSTKRRIDVPYDIDSQFMLPNLSATASPDTLRSSLLAANVPDIAISDIYIRQSPIGRFAVIQIAEGFVASDIRRQFMNGGMTKQRTVGTTQCSSSPEDIIDLTREESSSEAGGIFGALTNSHTGINIEMDRAPLEVSDEERAKSVLQEHIAIRRDTLTPSRASPIIISSDSEGSDVQVSGGLGRTHSPALSYLTLDERTSNAHTLADASNRSPKTGPYSASRWDWNQSASESSQSSEEETSEDEVHQEKLFSAIEDEPGGMDFVKQRLLAGGNVDELLDKLPLEQRHRIQKYLEATTTYRSRLRGHSSRGRARLQSPNPSRSESESESESDIDALETIRRLGTKRPKVTVPQTSRRRTSRRSGTPQASTDPVEHDGLTVVLPKAEHARGRRILIPGNHKLPIAAIYMRGDVQFINQSEEGVRYRISAAGLPAYNSGQQTRKVTDAVLLDDEIGVISYQRGPAQISCILFEQDRPRHVDLAHRGHSTVVEHKVKGIASKNPGISTLAPLSHSPRQFLSGGGDGTIRLWTLRTDRNSETTGTSMHLWEDYFPPVRCVAYSHAPGKVLFASSKSIYTRDLSGAKSSEELVTLSAEPRQIHVHPDNPSVVILEVDHLDRQMNLYDLRTSNFNARPSLEFGHREAKRGSVHRFTKGSIDGRRRLFVRGFDGDGTVHLWDYRNAKEAIKSFQRQRESVTHTVFSDDGIVAYGGYRVTFWKYS